MIVGTGIRTAGQLTIEAIGWLRAADEVLHLVPDPVAAKLIERLHPGREHSLRQFYAPGLARAVTYRRMAEFTIERSAAAPCLVVALYGHPGVFGSVAHLVVEHARTAGIPVQMLPGISAEDCLFADLGIDPADSGCASFDATDFVVHQRVVDPHAHLIIWQIGAVGELALATGAPSDGAVAMIVEKLTDSFPSDHEVVVYQASVVPGRPADAQRCALRDLGRTRLGSGSTLYVPPRGRPPRDPRFAPQLRPG